MEESKNIDRILEIQKELMLKNIDYDWKFVTDERIKKLQRRIDKALEYIDFIDNRHIFVEIEEVREIRKILKGE